ncbi:MAG: type II toxin-antitoxin system HipA family toxin [Phycisphaeraceae bacterium]|nr:MAG: type II toxin-antitoxin system HipA family toxin [Phycisphaeraceae bacterium]
MGRWRGGQRVTVAEVRMWGRQIGAVTIEGPGQIASFEYAESFRKSGVEISPLTMPLGAQIYRFPELPRESFYGLPGLLADSLPDKFGNAVIDAWLATQGRLPDEIDAVERLCYTGKRGMGALEFQPAQGPQSEQSTPIQVDALVELASEVLRGRESFQTFLNDGEKADALRDILRVGASAGGARAKAVIAWNPKTNEVRSGQVKAPPGFEHWILKFDGVSNNRDRELADPLGYGAIEYAYSLMARAAGIRTSDSRLFEENGRRHFMVRRFDRTETGEKIHMQSLAALAHFDFNAAGRHSYEQGLVVMRRLGLSMDEIEEQFRRMVFNVVARNQDDHVKNIAFLMDKQGRWSLSPAFDIIYSYNPSGAWTSMHQMSLNQKRDGFTTDDFRAVAETASMKRGRSDAILAEVIDAVRRWREFAEKAGVSSQQTGQIAGAHRLGFGEA